jgi:predicted Zn-dependent protease
MKLTPITRRNLVAALAGGAVLAGCQENADTGRKQFVVVSDAQLAELSATAWADLKAQEPIWANREAQARLQRVGEKIAAASGRTDQQWEFVAFDNPDVNAFVLPGGKVGFFRGLLEMAGGEDEIAAVMGHEAGHVVARHAAERLSQQLAVQAGVVVATIALSGEFGQFADEIAGALGMGAMYGVILPYSRQHELEADRLSVGLMAQAQFDPNGSLSFWQKMMALSGGGGPPALLSTHPANEDRLAALTAEIRKLGAA